MKNKIYLSLLLITLLSFIIISGCGGGNDGITQSSSIPTPTAVSSGSSYLTFNVVWPQQQTNSGSKPIMPSSINNKDITASMPNGTVMIVFYIYEYDETKPDHIGNPLIEGDPTEEDPRDDPYIILFPSNYIKLGPLPSTKVLIQAEVKWTPLSRH